MKPKLPGGWDWDDHVACTEGTSVWIDSEGDWTISQNICKPIPDAVIRAVQEMGGPKHVGG